MSPFALALRPLDFVSASILPRRQQLDCKRQKCNYFICLLQSRTSWRRRETPNVSRPANLRRQNRLSYAISKGAHHLSRYNRKLLKVVSKPVGDGEGVSGGITEAGESMVMMFRPPSAKVRLRPVRRKRRRPPDTLSPKANKVLKQVLLTFSLGHDIEMKLMWTRPLFLVSMLVMPQTAQQPSQIPTGIDDFLIEHSKRNFVVGSWGFNSTLNFTKMSLEETNVWFFEQVFNFLRSFFGILVPDNLEIITYNAKKRITKEKLNQMTFLDEFMLLMKGLADPLWVVRLNLNVVGFLRTDWDPDKPVRLQIQEPASFVVWGGPDEQGVETFSVSYRLFSEQKLEGENALLWSMNQPLLEKALKKWERQSRHKIDIVRSNSEDLSLFQHGFAKPAPASPRPKPPPPEEPPKQDYIPDLEDLLL